jgi:hypothetical protein
MLFSEVIDATDEKLVIERRVQVTMSWPQAKIASDFLGANINAFEAKNGPIKTDLTPTNPERSFTRSTCSSPYRAQCSETEEFGWLAAERVDGVRSLARRHPSNSKCLGKAPTGNWTCMACFEN